jgi:5'(3')-deoxyribonucleotidase
MNFDIIDNENFLIYAIKCYDRPHCVMSEFKEDLKRFNYLKRLFRRYRKTGELKERLILNHLVVIYNVFGVEAATRLLFLRMSEEDYSALKTFLLFLAYMPEKVVGIKIKNIISADIAVDMNVAESLRGIR